MNGISFIRENGGLFREVPGTDHISGLLIYGHGDVAPREVLSIEEASDLEQTNPAFHYHLSEYFREHPGSKVFIQGVAASDDTFTEVKTLQQFAKGEIKQLGIWNAVGDDANLQVIVTTINALAVELSTQKKPLNIVYSTKVTNLLALPDTHTFKCENVSVCIGQDGAGRGNFLKATIPGLGMIGAALGAVSRAKVNESIAWVARQNLVSVAYPKAMTGGELKARELDEVAFMDDATKLEDLTPAQVQSLNDKGYIFPIKHQGIAGSYFNDSYTCTSLDSDFAYIENNRTLNKAIRSVNAKMLPVISGPVYIDDESGRLEEDTVTSFEAMAEMPLEQMERDGEISGLAVSINPNQSVLQNSELEMVVEVVPVGVLRKLTTKIGFTLNIPQ